MTITRLSSNTPGTQDGSIWKEDLNVTAPGHSVITKLIPGDNVRIVSTGADQGTGEVTVHVDLTSDPVLTPTEYKLNNIPVSTRTRLNLMNSAELRFQPVDDSINDQTSLTLSVGEIDFGKIKNFPNTLSDLGIIDATLVATFNNHAADDTLHMTPAQNAMIDGLLVGSNVINHLAGATSNIQDQINTKEVAAMKGAANGYAPLNQNKLIPVSFLPSYVNTVEEHWNLADFPLVGSNDIIYYDKTEKKQYRWTGTDYLYINSGAVQLVNGYNGVVDLNNTDIGLGNVTNDKQLKDSQVLSITGDATAPSTLINTGALNITFNASGVTAGTYGDSTHIVPFTVNAKGLMTATSTPVTITPAFSSITGKPTTKSGYGITDVANISGDVNQDFSTKTLVSGNILPSATNTFDIGSPTLRFASIYVNEARLSTNTLYIGDTPILGTDQNTVIIHADLNQSIDIATSGTGTTTLESAKAVTLTTNGMNADVLVNATGAGSNVRLGAANELQVTATGAVFNCPVTAASQSVTGNLTVGGNLVVNGTQSTVNSTVVNIKDNIITLNSGEVGSGVTLGKSGIQVDRGDLADYQFIFDETDDYFKMGAIGSLEVVASQPWANGRFSLTTHNHTLDSLSNITITSKADNQFLRSSGTSWVNGGLLASDIPSLDWSKITTGKPTTASGYGLTDVVLTSTFNTHVADNAKHLTSAQNTWLDSVTASAVEVNYLVNVTSSVQTQINSKEPTLAAGSATQYYRGDKSWQTLNKAAVGLNNVDNVSDANKPISTAAQAALDLKANQATTYTKVETDAAIQAVVGAAPAALNTLAEIATQLASDESAAAALTNTVATKADKSTTYTKTEVDALIAQAISDFAATLYV